MSEEQKAAGSAGKKRLTEFVIVGVVLSALLIVLLTLGTPGRNPRPGELELELTVSSHGEVIFTESVEAQTDVTLMDILKSSVTENGGVIEEGGFITSICGHEQDAQAGEYWMYTVNGEFLPVGAAEYYPSDGDKVAFTFDVAVW